jgi:prolyl oligopeptidase
MSQPQHPSMSVPPARRGDHIDRLHGIEIPDPYRWMEELESPETETWIEAQRAYTEAWLSRIPARQAIRERLDRLAAFERVGLPAERGGRLFFTVHDGIRSQPVLYWSDGGDGPAVLLDPNDLSDDGTVAIVHFAPSPDGRLVAYGLSEAGSDWQTWRIRNVETGTDLEDELRVQFADPAWLVDSSGFVYLHTPPPTGHWLRAQAPHRRLALHRVGSAQAVDEILYERPDEPDWIYTGRVTDDGRYLVVTIGRGTHPEKAVGIIDLEREGFEFTWLLDRFDAQYVFLGSHERRFLFQTTHEAPRGRIVEIDLDRPGSDEWREIVPQDDDVLVSTILADERLVCLSLHDAASRIVVRALGGSIVASPELPGIGTIIGMTGRSDGRFAYLSYTDVGRPETIYRLEVATGRMTLFREADLPFDPAAIHTERRFYESCDGTRIPIFISRAAGRPGGPDAPTILYGYGGFNASETPVFRLAHRVWLDMGGQLAVACIRGGGEYGEAWHRAGIRENRWTSFADFCSAAEWLISERLTSTPRLAASGRSNGGLLVGACMTMRPELFGAALPAVGVHDMLRFHRFTVGRYWVSDFGSPEDPEMFPLLLRYSPLHNVRPGTTYPPTLILTADHDDRVYPAHSFKFGAALQHAQAGSAPILVRIDERSGHGMGKPLHKELDEIADVCAFLVDVFDMDVILPHGRSTR